MTRYQPQVSNLLDPRIPRFSLELWKKMNGWVYSGFEITYHRIGSDFDRNYYESETYLPGKKFVEEGLAQGVFFKKPDGSVWIDLTAEGLDEKLRHLRRLPRLNIHYTGAGFKGLPRPADER